MSREPEAKKSLGQHWLSDAASLEAMVDAADVRAGDNVLEIGPGYGTLTEHLLSRGAEVIALEYDPSLIPRLQKKFGSAVAGSLLVEQGDIRGYDFSALPPDYKIVANIPYYLTSNLIQLISETPNQPVRAALLVQKEVAERVAAAPGDMSLLSVTAQFYWRVSLGQKVPAALFTPAPKIDSQIVILERRAEPQFPDVNPKDFFRLVKAGFSQRRKTLLNALSAGLQLSKPETLALLEQAAIDPQLRPQTLDLADWYRLYQFSGLFGPSSS